MLGRDSKSSFLKLALMIFYNNFFCKRNHLNRDNGCRVACTNTRCCCDKQGKKEKNRQQWRSFKKFEKRTSVSLAICINYQITISSSSLTVTTLWGLCGDSNTLLYVVVKTLSFLLKSKWKKTKEAKGRMLSMTKRLGKLCVLDL